MQIRGNKNNSVGFINIYQNKAPIYEILSGASIAVAAIFLIIPGFFTDAGVSSSNTFTRKLFIKFVMKNTKSFDNDNSKILDGEVVEDKKDEL